MLTRKLKLELRKIWLEREKSGNRSAMQEVECFFSCENVGGHSWYLRNKGDPLRFKSIEPSELVVFTLCPGS